LFKVDFLFLGIPNLENVKSNEENASENNNLIPGDERQLIRRQFLRRKLQTSNISTPKKEETTLTSTPKSSKRHSLMSKQNDSNSSINPLLNLTEKVLQQYLDEITRKLEEISVVDSKWDERLKSIQLLHSISVTTWASSDEKPQTFSSHPIFINAVTNSLLRVYLSKQFSDGRSSMIKSFCECVSSIASHAGVCSALFLLFIIFFFLA
jgi:hypothetical protein